MKVRILFTKNIENNYVKQYLDNNKFELLFLPVIKVKSKNVNFEIKYYKNFIFTSANAVKCISENIFPDDSFFFTVGEKSCKELEKLGYSVKITSKNANELFKEIKNNIKPCNLLHFCSSEVLPTLEENFSKTDFKYKKIEVYQTIKLFPKLNNQVDALVFFSPSGVESFIKNNEIFNKKLFAIGETTAKEIKKYTNEKIFISKNENTEGILKMIKECYK